MIQRVEINRNGTLAEVRIYDGDAGTFTRSDAAGNVLETRALTAEELASVTPPPPVPNPAADALDAAAADAEVSPVADVRALAVHLRTAADALRGQG